jgi:hexosaminidase
MLLPRMLALAEVAWAPVANKNYKDFAETRLPGHMAWLDKGWLRITSVPPAIGGADTVNHRQYNLTVNLKIAGAGR